MTDRPPRLDRPRTRVRRADRQLDDPAWIRRFLTSASFGFLAFVDRDRPAIHSNQFWLDGESIWLHTGARTGLAAQLAGPPRPACFSVAEQGRLLPAGHARDFSTEYAGVVVYGSIGPVDDPAERRRVMEGFMAKYAPHLAPGTDYQPMTEEMLAKVTVYRFAIEEWVGKHNVKPADVPGYRFPGGSFIDALREAGRITGRAVDD